MNTPVFKCTLAEEDFDKASHYGSNSNCLIATMLKRHGFYRVNVGGETALFWHDGKRYDCDVSPSISCQFLEHKGNGVYRRELIGTEFTFTPIK